jgi:hypothetical protein
VGTFKHYFKFICNTWSVPFSKKIERYAGDGFVVAPQQQQNDSVDDHVIRTDITDKYFTKTLDGERRYVPAINGNVTVGRRKTGLSFCDLWLK